MTDSRIDTVVGRYRIVRRIGQGGMGVVYEAVAEDTAERVALKCLHPTFAEDKSILKRFYTELRAATVLDHPNVVRVRDVGNFPDGTAFMALEYLEGRDLATELKSEGPIRIDRLIRIALEVLRGLAAAHRRGIVHRDLKPDNVFLAREADGSERVKILDFGIAKILGTDVAATTRTGTTIGTPHYMSPEQAQGKKDVDPRSDLYGIGVLIFRALTGQYPFDDTSYPMLVIKICTEPPPSLRTYRKDVPVELDEVVLRLLEKEPDARPSTAEDVIDLLEPFAALDVAPQLSDAQPTRTLPTAVKRVDPHADTEVREPPPAPRGFDVRIFSIAIVAIVVIGALVAFLSGGDDEVVPETPETSLPEPKPFVSAPLRANTSEGGGWQYMNPLPRSMPTWYDAAVMSADLAVFVGHAGQAARFDRGGVYSWPTGTDRPLLAAIWIGPDTVLAAGEHGTLVRLRLGQAPHAIESGTTEHLHALAATSPTTAIAAGENGTLLEIRGDAVTALASGTDADLLALAAREGEVFVAGQDGTILRFAGGRATRLRSSTGATLRAIGGCPGAPLYAAGDRGTLVRRDSEGRFRSVDTNTEEALLAIGCDRERAVIAGRKGVLLLASASRTVTLPTGTEGTLYAAASAAEAPTWIAGEQGRLFLLDDDHVVKLTDGPTVPLRAGTVVGGAIVAVGEWGRIVRQTEGGFEEMESPTRAALAAIVRYSDERAFAVGDNGAIVEIRYDSARLIESPTTESLRDVIESNGTFLAVGTNGTVLRGFPSAFEVQSLRDVPDLWSVTGDATSAIAAGNEGTVVRVSAGGFSRVDCGTTDGLRSIVRFREDFFAVGERGVIARVAEGGCTIERAPSPSQPALNAVDLGPNGRPLAVGDEGAMLERGDDGTWRDLGLDVGRASLRGIFRTTRDVIVAGSGGVLVRHVRVDGT
jgi:serine/threonine-protein kinase